MKFSYRILSLAVRLVIIMIPAPALAAELNVALEDIRSDDGKLMIAILDSEAAFKGESPAVASLLLTPSGEQASFSLNSLPPGRYAIQVMHDLNGNDALDSNLVGMPTEPWAFSNNAKGNFGPPDWNAISFELTDNTQQTISLNY